MKPTFWIKVSSMVRVDIHETDEMLELGFLLVGGIPNLKKKGLNQTATAAGKMKKRFHASRKAEQERPGATERTLFSLPSPSLACTSP